MKSFVFLFLVSIVLFAACKKEEASANITYEYVDENLKLKFSFQTGDYWLYKDDLGNTDSVIVESVTTGFTSTIPNSSLRKEYISVNYFNVTQNKHFNHYLFHEHIKYNGGGQWGQNGQPIYSYGKNIGFEFNGFSLAQKLDSLGTIAGMFYDVEKTTIIASEQYEPVFDDDVDFYFSPFVGVIKYVNHEPNADITWELKSYSIH